jgi:hypothetical protein
MLKRPKVGAVTISELDQVLQFAIQALSLVVFLAMCIQHNLSIFLCPVELFLEHRDPHLDVVGSLHL